MINRYDAEGAQSSFQAGSNEQVLSNKLGITDPEDMDDAELVLLEKLYQSVLIEHLPDRPITVQDLKDWHRHWLGNICPWAGEIRAVNLGKDGFFFAAAPQIARLLDGFEKDCLTKYTPCRPDLDENLIRAIAVTHVEFILFAKVMGASRDYWRMSWPCRRATCRLTTAVGNETGRLILQQSIRG